MARKLRFQFPGALYYLMSRANRRKDIFLTATDRNDFIRLLAETCRKTGWQVHAYCLMRDRYHLVVQTPKANLVDGMSWLQSAYSIRFNLRHRRSGAVFAGRYKSKFIDTVERGYLRIAADYVHLQAIPAASLKPGQPLSKYPWSSFPFYLAGRRQRPEWLQVLRLMAEHGIFADTAAVRRTFERRIEQVPAEGESKALAEQMRRGWCLGSARFKARLLQRMGEHVPSGRTRRRRSTAKAAQIVKEELKRLRWTTRDLNTRPKGDPDKLAIAERLRRETTLSVREIASRVKLGTPKGANMTLHHWMRRHCCLTPRRCGGRVDKIEATKPRTSGAVVV